jgi:hypothetical protein
MLRPKFDPAPEYKAMINIGAGLDIPTGHSVTGAHGESILNGGLGLLTGVVGIGNNFKSTVMDYMMLSAMDRIACMTETSGTTYDTELNRQPPRMTAMSQKFDSFKDKDIVEDGTWLLSDKTQYYADPWYEILKQFLRDKRDNAKKLTAATPFITKDGKPFEILIPTYTSIDSFTLFETENIAKIQDENLLGESGGNVIHMRQGLAKTRFMMEIPAIAARAQHYVLLTAHIGKDLNIASGPIPQAPVKKLQHLKNGDKIKGVTDQFFFLLSNCWHAYNASPLLNQTTKGPEYPLHADEALPGDLDLNQVSLRQLRGKSGMTGFVLNLIVSQNEGVLPGLTEFHYLKDQCNRFGISGSNTNYSLDLYPSLKLTRPTIRHKLNQDPLLRRAMNITSELAQMHQYWRYLKDEELLCTPQQLFDDLIKLGWDWQVLLATRGWWTVNNDQHPVPFLSTMDLLHMRKGLYHPYWAGDDKLPKTR